MADLAKVKRNVSKMVGMGAPETDIDAYIASEGTSVDAVRAFKPGIAPDDPRMEYIRQAQERVARGEHLEVEISPMAAADPSQRMPQYGGAAMNTTAGVNEALYGIAGAPIDLMRGAMNLGIQGVNAASGTDIGQIRENSFGGSRFIAESLGAVNPVLDPRNTEARTLEDRIARGVGQGVAGTVAPAAIVGGLSRAGAIGPQLSQMGAQAFGRSGSVGAVAGDAVAGAGAGAGAALASEFTPEQYRGIGSLAGGLAGGGVGALLTGIPRAVQNVAGVARDFAAPLSSGGREAMAGRQLRDAATNPQAARDALGSGIVERVPGSQPTTFQQTGDMGLGALERSAQTRDPVPFQDRRASQNAARVEALGGMQAASAPDAVSRTIRERLASIDQQTQAPIDNVIERARASADALGAGQSPEQAGSTLRAAVESARAGAKEQERALWGAVDPDGSLVVPSARVRDGAKRLLDEMPVSERRPEGEEAAILDTLTRYGDAMPFNEIVAMRSRLSDALRTERQTNGESRAYRRLSMIRSAIEEDLSAAASGKVAREAEAISAGRLDPRQSTAARLDAVSAPAVSRKVFTPSGRSFDVDYQLVEADDLIGSNLPDGRPNPRYPAGLQPRDRTRAASDTQVAGIARNLQPERLGPSADAATGAPIIGPDNVIESGNGRVAGISRAYGENGPSSAAYRDYLAREGYPIEGMRKPVLVRRRIGDMSEADRVRFTQEANASQSLALSASEQAATDASRLSPDILGLYRGGDVSSAENRDFAKAFLGTVADKGQEGAFVTGRGSLSLDGATRMRTALLRSAYDDGRLIAALADEGDENIRAFGRAMGDIAGDVARLRSGIKTGEIDAKADLAPALSEAARIVQAARSSGKRIADAVAQQDAFTRISDSALQVLKMAYGDGLNGRLSREKLTSVMRQAVNEAEQQTAGARLFGEALDASTILQGARARYGNASLPSSEADIRGTADLAGYGQGRPGNRGPGALPDGPSRSQGTGTGGLGGGRGQGPIGDRILDRPALTPNFDSAALGRLNAASNATRNRAQTFDNSSIGPIRRRPSAGAPYDMPSSEVVGRIFFPQPKSFEVIQKYRAAVGDESALRSLEGYAVDRLRKAALNDDGTFNPSKLEAFRRSHADALRAFPQLDERIRDAGAASATMADVVASRKAALDAAQTGILGRLIGVEEPQDVTRIVGGLFGRQDSLAQFKRLQSAIGSDKNAKEGLRKAVADYVTGRFIGNTEVATSGQAGIKADQFQSFVKDNRPALRLIFSEDEVATMQAVADDLQQANRSLTAVKIPGQSNTAQDQFAIRGSDSPMSTLAKIAAASAATGGSVGMMSGSVSAVAATVGVGLLGALRENGIRKVDDLIRDALLNPERARILLEKVGTESAAKTERELIQRYRASVAASGILALDENGRDAKDRIATLLGSAVTPNSPNGGAGVQSVARALMGVAPVSPKPASSTRTDIMKALIETGAGP